MVAVDEEAAIEIVVAGTIRKLLDFGIGLEEAAIASSRPVTARSTY